MIASAAAGSAATGSCPSDSTGDAGTATGTAAFGRARANSETCTDLSTSGTGTSGIDTSGTDIRGAEISGTDTSSWFGAAVCTRVGRAAASSAVGQRAGAVPAESTCGAPGPAAYTFSAATDTGAETGSTGPSPGRPDDFPRIAR